MTNSLSLQIAAQGAALREDTTEVIEEPVESPQTVTEVPPEESKVGTNSVRRGGSELTPTKLRLKKKKVNQEPVSELPIGKNQKSLVIKRRQVWVQECLSLAKSNATWAGRVLSGSEISKI